MSAAMEARGISIETILIVAAVVLVGHAAWRMARAANRAREAGAAGPVAGRAVRDAAWWWRRAERAAADGNHSEAMLAGFRAAMLELERRGVIRYRPSATPREVLRGAGLPVPVRDGLDPLVATLYGVVFARQPVDGPAFHAWLTELRGTVGASAH